MVTTRFLRQAAFCSVMSLVVSSIVQAQPPQGGAGGQPPQGGGQRGGRQGGFGGGGFGGGGFAPRIDRATLLGNDKVREELKIEEAQAATIDAALAAYREERTNAPRLDRNALQDLSEEERTAAMEKSRKEREELSKKTDDVMNALLEPAQTKRLDEITFQVRMDGATLQTLKADDIKTKLSITEDQLTKFAELEVSAAADMQKMFEEMRANGGGRGAGGGGGGNAAGGGGAFQEVAKKMEEARSKVTESVMATLTDDQKKQIEEMRGAKFEIDLRSMMGGRGGPGGGGAPGGGRGAGGGRGTRPPAEL